MLRQLSAAASRKHGDDLVVRVESVPLAETFPVHGSPHRSDQRVPDKFHGDAGLAKKLFFKWKDAQRLHKPPAHQIRAPRPPGPELRADVINIFRAAGFQLANPPQMKAGEVGEDGKRRL